MPAILAYRPFVDPLPLYHWWFALILPLCLLFSVVYKCGKCNDVREIPRAAIGICVWILFGMATAAIALTLIVKLQEH